MPGLVTDVTELSTALGTLTTDLRAVLARPDELRFVDDVVWSRYRAALDEPGRSELAETAFANGRSFLESRQGLRTRRPLVVEWKGPHRAQSEDVIPVDLRFDHVYLVSCKYLSKILLNTSPSRLFQHRLNDAERTGRNWFEATAPGHYARFYAEAIGEAALTDHPAAPGAMTPAQQAALRERLSSRVLPSSMQPSWRALCQEVSRESARTWRKNLASQRVCLQVLWRLLRIGAVTYFVLGSDREASLRLRVMSSWDWNQAFELRDFVVAPRDSGQPEVAYSALVRSRSSSNETVIEGHVEIRWSHGRFVGSPEAKVYLDTPHSSVPGYELIH